MDTSVLCNTDPEAANKKCNDEKNRANSTHNAPIACRLQTADFLGFQRLDHVIHVFACLFHGRAVVWTVVFAFN